jgi:hypothetical protein
MRIRALSVFEGVVYHSWAVDRSDPARPTLEVDAVLREGDADAGPLLLPVPEFVVMAGGPQVARPAVEALAARGRIVDHLGVPHVAFPLWSPVGDDEPEGAP